MNGGAKSMANRRVLTDTVVLQNYIGEVNDEAAYQETTLVNCYFPTNEGADLNIQGKKANDSGRLYVFDKCTIAKAQDGTIRTYMPYEQWWKLADKRPYWTLSDKGSDYMKKLGSNTRLRVVGFSHKKAGTRRMWHFEVDGR